MNTKGKPRLVTHPETGKTLWSMYPLTLEDAVIEGLNKYHPMTPCPTHSHNNNWTPAVYVKTNMRTCCAEENAQKEYHAAVAVGEPTDPSTAKRMNLFYYWSVGHHAGCGHPGKRLLNGKCYFCKDESMGDTPRQIAIAQRQSWYMPVEGDLCKNGHHALRRTNNGSCKQCELEAKLTRRALRNKPVPIYRDPALADMILDRKVAASLGLVAYRTGVPCRNGHLGFRFVSTGGCIECKMPKKGDKN